MCVHNVFDDAENNTAIASAGSNETMKSADEDAAAAMLVIAEV